MKQVQNMTLEEAKNFFEQLKYMLKALPNDKAEQVLNDTCEAFFKTFSLERNDLTCECYNDVRFTVTFWR